MGPPPNNWGPLHICQLLICCKYTKTLRSCFNLSNECILRSKWVLANVYHMSSHMYTSWVTSRCVFDIIDLLAIPRKITAWLGTHHSTFDVFNFLKDFLGRFIFNCWMTLGFVHLNNCFPFEFPCGLRSTGCSCRSKLYCSNASSLSSFWKSTKH